MRTIRRPPKDPLDHEPSAVFQARKDAGLTQAEVAKRCRVSRSLIAEIELGTRNANSVLLDKLAAVCGCAREDLERKRETEAAPAADVDVQQVRDAERAEPVALQNVRR